LPKCESPDAVDSLVPFFCRRREGLPLYQSLNREFLPCLIQNTFKSQEVLKIFPISFTQRRCINDQYSMSKLPTSKQQTSLQLRMTDFMEDTSSRFSERENPYASRGACSHSYSIYSHLLGMSMWHTLNAGLAWCLA
ncbi:hypothetical protein M405DRAFT_821025, partial [Rhizopogon salebrosus TDB-379]